MYISESWLWFISALIGIAIAAAWMVGFVQGSQAAARSFWKAAKNRRDWKTP